VSYRLTPKAQEGFLRIAEHVHARFGLEVVERVLDRLERAFELLASSPEAGHLREDLTDSPGVRFWAVGPTLIAYRAKGDLVEILFVERGELDWQRFIQREQ
jgi:plasmid stabilization system protein ParE